MKDTRLKRNEKTRRRSVPFPLSESFQTGNSDTRYGEAGRDTKNDALLQRDPVFLQTVFEQHVSVEASGA